VSCKAADASHVTRLLPLILLLLPVLLLLTTVMLAGEE
jgi:hypothetical protein